MGVTESDVHNSWARFFYGEGVKPSHVKSPLFKKAVHLSCVYGPGYQLPQYKSMLSTLLDTEVTRIEDDVVKPLMKTVRKFSGTVASDGWTDACQHPLLNVMLFTKSGSTFIKSYNAEGHTKTKEWIARFMVKTIKRDLPCDRHKVICVVMDGVSAF